LPEATGIYRGEVLAILGALADIRTDVLYAIRLLENDDEAEEEEEDA
jgi:cytosine/adenosine deaminase-related metal-dependent hydrolase